MDAELGRHLAEADEDVVEAGVGVPVDPPEVVALAVALEVGELGRGAAPAGAVLAGHPFGARATGQEHESPQTSQDHLVKERSGRRPLR